MSVDEIFGVVCKEEEMPDDEVLARSFEEENEDSICYAIKKELKHVQEGEETTGSFMIVSIY